MKKNVGEIVQGLRRMFPEPECALRFETPFQLLVAVMLSAQCTDKRVNQVTVELFKEHGDPQRLAELSEAELGKKIFSCGFWKVKARNILLSTRCILLEHGGEVPNDFEVLCSFPGVGRKTASVVMSNAFCEPHIAVDTHVGRFARRMGVASKTADGIQKKLESVVPREDWIFFHQSVVLFGREVCKSQSPLCSNCPFFKFCKHENGAKAMKKVKNK